MYYPKPKKVMMMLLKWHNISPDNLNTFVRNPKKNQTNLRFKIASSLAHEFWSIASTDQVRCALSSDNWLLSGLENENQLQQKKVEEEVHRHQLTKDAIKKAQELTEDLKKELQQYIKNNQDCKDGKEAALKVSYLLCQPSPGQRIFQLILRH